MRMFACETWKDDIEFWVGKMVSVNALPTMSLYVCLCGLSVIVYVCMVVYTYVCFSKNGELRRLDIFPKEKKPHYLSLLFLPPLSRQ